MLDSGEFATITELAEREKITLSYLTRVLQLTLLAPEIVEAILHGTQGSEVSLARVLEPFPVEWEEAVLLRLAAKAAEEAHVYAAPLAVRKLIFFAQLLLYRAE